jgi:serine/threonine-protein kinase
MPDERQPRDRRRQTEVLRQSNVPSGHHLSPGDQIGEYEIEALIGRGGMGTVYRAFQRVIERNVAVKVLTNSSAPRAVERFLQEARAVARVKHRAIPEIHTFGTLPSGLQYYVMELLEGEDLRALIRRGGAVEPAKAIHILEQVADGLQAAHQCGIVHRDLKPDNVFLCRAPSAPFGLEVKLLDFGIAKLMETESDPEQQVSAGAIVGTPAYMPLEQLLGGAVSVRSDVYSLGCVAHEMLAGERPFDPTATADLIRDKTIGKRRMLAEIDAELARFDHAIGVALSPDANERYATPPDFVSELREALSVDEARADTVTFPDPPRSLYLERRRSRTVRTAAAVALAALIGSLALLLGAEEEQEPPARAERAVVVEPVSQPPRVAPAEAPRAVKEPEPRREAPRKVIAPPPPKAKKSGAKEPQDELLPEMPIRF